MLSKKIELMISIYLSIYLRHIPKSGAVVHQQLEKLRKKRKRKQRKGKESKEKKQKEREKKKRKEIRKETKK